MSVTYTFALASGDSRIFRVSLDSRPDDPQTEKPDWTRLSHCQCSNCPLKKTDTAYCPAAVDILPVVEEFQDENAYQKVTVMVDDERRRYEKETTLEEALRSLLGLIMATSRCPILGELRPMAIHHMPFASSEEFIMRSVSLYLLQQYFAKRHDGKPDWELEGLVGRNQRLQLVNQALWQRIHTVCKGDSNLKALLNFFSMASSVTFSLETQLRKLETRLAEEGVNGGA
ncbi:hypothetical protein RE428_22120 [Marinobacter nanhaiticus D15-8W]|uniref:Uncharacterized protein n=1 Tax=Marinobacter nanhaiticus D15-8W TaxID=626887 RepID=N6VUK4_9GAMM|nr:hypothetical protein [Marinobacter nanhaiticus]ENO13820.1 hypothetical protein J057_20530 [Marinobacter nanhaiticus D15-8W]BES71194.1 hypothetical protein RE428_22120 [Marinobacter nanhaiticus D15-8W]